MQLEHLQPIVTVPVTLQVPIILLTVRYYSSSNSVKMRHTVILVARTASLKRSISSFIFLYLNDESLFEDDNAFLLELQFKRGVKLLNLYGSILNTRDNSWCSHLIPCSVEKALYNISDEKFGRAAVLTFMSSFYIHFHKESLINSPKRDSQD